MRAAWRYPARQSFAVTRGAGLHYNNSDALGGGVQVGHLVAGVLSKGMLLSCEVALEYMLALTYSPQARQPPPGHGTRAMCGRGEGPA